MAKIDITKPVKLKNPEDAEESKLIYKVTNFNEVTRRAYITPVNSGLSFPGEELVEIEELINVEIDITDVERAVIAEITEKIKATCSISKYANLCNRIKTEAGLAYVVNRCIKSMSNDKIKLSSALANLEAEMEGID